jgi:hypothetical protein
MDQACEGQTIQFLLVNFDPFQLDFTSICGKRHDT